MPHPVVIATSFTDPAVAFAKERFDVQIVAEGDIDAAIDAAAAKQAEAIVVFVSKVTAAHFERMPKSVKLVATASVGFDHIDLAAAKAAGIWVSNTPDVLTDATADMSLFLMLGACRRGKEMAQGMADGWRRGFGFNELLGLDVSVRTLGIVGMGRIGQAIARRAKGFGMKIIYHNRNRLPPELEGGATYYASLDEMLAHTDVLSLAAPGSGVPLITRERIALLPRGAVLVNIGRGSLVDEDALIEALKSGQLAAAGLDVFAAEPAYDLRLRDLPNAFLTPHRGSGALETRTAMAMRALQNVAAVVDGGEPGDRVV